METEIYWAERPERANRLWSLLHRTGELLFTNQLIDSVEVVLRHDVHAFYGKGDRLVHVQAYPGMSDADQMITMIRPMNRVALYALRAQRLSIGNEHEAVNGPVAFNQELPYGEEVLVERVRALL